MRVDHLFERGPNPRSHNSCVRCGRVPSFHPDPPPEPEGTRDPAFERQFTEAACAGVVDPAALNDLAEARAHPGPIRDLLTRDLDRDGLEELADLRNYVVWAVQQLDARMAAGMVDEETYSQRRLALGWALQYAAVSFSLLSECRAMLR